MNKKKCKYCGENRKNKLCATNNQFGKHTQNYCKACKEKHNQDKIDKRKNFLDNRKFKCKYCGEEDLDKLKRDKNWGKIITYNVCKICYGNNMSKVIHKLHKEHPEIGRKISESNKGRKPWNTNKKLSEQHKINIGIGVICSNKYRVALTTRNQPTTLPSKSKECKEKISKTKTGMKLTQQWKDNIGISNMFKIRTKEWCENIGNGNRGKIIGKLGRQHMREGKLRYIQKCIGDGVPISPTVGRNETFILNKIEKEKGIKIIRQYYCVGYWIDGYDEVNNVVYEVNEGHHFSKDGNYTKRHIRRKKEIIEKLKCKWVDIKDC